MAATGRRSGKGSGRVRAAVALGAVLAIATTGTYAYWTDSVPVSGVTITTGTLDLKVNNADSTTTYDALSLSNMMPGNTTAGVLTVRNAGTVPLTYYANAAASNGDGKGLGAALVVKVTGDGSVSGSGSSRTCAGSALSNTGTAFGTSLVGTSAQPRQLAVGASETLCVQAALPASAASSLQGATTNVSFTFNASQVI